MAEEHLLVVISGKQRHVRLIPVRALDGDDVEWIKVAETKGTLTLTTGVMRPGPPSVYCLCVAVKRQVSLSLLKYIQIIIINLKKKTHRVVKRQRMYLFQFFSFFMNADFRIHHKSSFMKSHEQKPVIRGYEKYYCLHRHNV